MVVAMVVNGGFESDEFRSFDERVMECCDAGSYSECFHGGDSKHH